MSSLENAVVNRDYRKYIGSEKTGRLLENTVFSRLSTACPKSVKCIRATVEEDRYKGIDFRINGVPADVTYALDRKANVVERKTYGAWEFALRTGNGVVKFDEPVLVIALRMGTKQIQNEILEDITTVLKDVRRFADMVSDTYWPWYDKHTCDE